MTRFTPARLSFKQVGGATRVVPPRPASNGKIKEDWSGPRPVGKPSPPYRKGGKVVTTKSAVTSKLKAGGSSPFEVTTNPLDELQVLVDHGYILNPKSLAEVHEFQKGNSRTAPASTLSVLYDVNTGTLMFSAADYAMHDDIIDSFLGKRYVMTKSDAIGFGHYEIGRAHV